MNSLTLPLPVLITSLHPAYQNPNALELLLRAVLDRSNESLQRQKKQWLLNLYELYSTELQAITPEYR